MENEIINKNLLSVVFEIAQQKDIGATFPKNMQSFDEQINQILEYIEEANECGIAYEIVMCLLEQFPFILKGPTVIKLLEVALLFKYKTERPEDSDFDSR